MRRRSSLVALLALAALTLVAPAGAEDDEPRAEVRALTDGIRDDLVQMNFDQALAAIDTLLARPDLTDGERGEVLVLRAQAHGAFGDFDAVEQDYAEILALRPGYVPDPGLTPDKAMARFDKVHKRTIGQVRVEVVPEDAKLRVDGVETTIGPGGVLSLLAGEHTIRAERRGHDPDQRIVEVEAGKEALLGFELVPNARTVVLGTVPADVAVSLDGEPVGLTATSTDDGGIGEPEARLVIEDVPLGEHVFELSKECFRTERLSDNLNVDLLTREPKHYKTVRMVPARTQVTLRGGPSDGQLTIDDRPAGRLSGEPVSACPGDRTFVVSVGGRVVWQHDVTLRDAVDEVLEVAPRPNLVRVGTERWPRGLEAFGAAFNLLGERELPRGRDLLQADAWEEMRLPDAVDLALAVVPPSRAGAPDRWYLYSPILDRAVLVDGDPPDPSRPQWTAVTWGFDVVDSEIGGANVVVGVEAGGTAATAGMKVGDRLVEIAGRAVASAAETRATLANARPEAPLRVAWTTAAGERREEELTGRVGPLLVVPAAESAAALVRAAWAAVDTLTRPELAAAAMANLALLFEAAGQPAAAVDAWRRVDWGDRPGVGEGTRQYYLGRALVRLGREAQALEALRKAAATRATAFSDDGPPIAPAAADHLADLGTTPD